MSKEEIGNKKAEKSGFSLMHIVNGNILTRDFVLKNIAFLLYLSLLALVYIGNGFYADSKVIAIATKTQELKELRSKYISNKSLLMRSSKQSELASLLKSKGVDLKESMVPPHKIVRQDGE